MKLTIEKKDIHVTMRLTIEKKDILVTMKLAIEKKIANKVAVNVEKKGILIIMKESTTIYTLRERYRSKMYKDIILNELITFVFYFVFNILFQDHPNYPTLKQCFMLLFMAIAAALLVFGKKRADRIRSIHYEVKKQGLEYYDGRKTIFYPWNHFKEVKKNRNRISMIYPYEFHTEEGMFTLHRQLDKPDELIPVILEKTKLEVIEN